MKILVIGTGYVGLVTGVCFADTGNNVMCIDIDDFKVASLKAGNPAFYEPKLEYLLKQNISAGRIGFSTDIKSCINNTEIIFLALPTPEGENGSADISRILEVAYNLGSLISNDTIVVNKSTSPVGTTDLIRSEIVKNCKHNVDVVSNPEFLREGSAVEDFLKPDRVIVGTNSEFVKGKLTSLYNPFIRQGNPIIFMDTKSAELCKYACNGFLATKISFINEISVLCDRVGANVENVRLGMIHDKRIGKEFLYPGIGYGGSCFPKDIRAIIKLSEEFGLEMSILNSVERVNVQQQQYFFSLIENRFKSNLKGLRFAIWGLSFKPNTDDIRQAPSINVIRRLLECGAMITVYDPKSMGAVEKIFGNSILYAHDKYEALVNANSLLILTEWSEFYLPDFRLMLSKLRNHIIFDGRNIYNLNEITALGFEYYCLGRNFKDI